MFSYLFVSLNGFANKGTVVNIHYCRYYYAIAEPY